jgi:hypothetical protein
MSFMHVLNELSNLSLYFNIYWHSNSFKQQKEETQLRRTTIFGRLKNMFIKNKKYSPELTLLQIMSLVQPDGIEKEFRHVYIRK